MKTVITFGTYDVFHLGHVKLLERAASLGDQLIVGVSTDQMNFDKKQRYPVYSEDDRMTIISAMRYCSLCFKEESLDKKGEYIERYNADVLVMGDDWEGRFDMFKDQCEVVYLPRTPNVSTTELLEAIASRQALLKAA